MSPTKPLPGTGISGTGQPAQLGDGLARALV